MRSRWRGPGCRCGLRLESSPVLASSRGAGKFAKWSIASCIVIHPGPLLYDLPNGPRPPYLDQMSTQNEPAIKHMEAVEMDLFAAENPRSVINLVPENLREFVKGYLTSHKDYFHKTESELLQRLRDDSCPPSDTDHAIRYRFWLEYDRTISHGKAHMTMSNVYSGIVSKAYFFNIFPRRAQHVAWMFCPPTDYIAIMKSVLYNTYRFMAQVSSQHIDIEDLSTKELAELKLKVYREAELRLTGTKLKEVPVQVNIQNIQNNSKELLEKTVVANDLEALQKQQRELRRREQMLDGIAPAIEPEVAKALNMTKEEGDEE